MPSLHIFSTNLLMLIAALDDALCKLRTGSWAGRHSQGVPSQDLVHIWGPSTSHHSEAWPHVSPACLILCLQGGASPAREVMCKHDLVGFERTSGRGSPRCEAREGAGGL